ncbi:dCTP deaminase [Candidatus Micrarchaeota archaeon CG_4_10_14_0_2_um_filter_55_9]|nr:MAG: dCTP deaminase [Candidatus Micrarchaeota archaeon CG_4_10_14_0_2_um_filter_55_9]
MILSRAALLEAIQNKEIIITPFDESLVGPCSIDFRLGNEFRVYRKTNRKTHLDDEFSYSKEYYHTRKLECGEALPLKPGQLVLGVTLEQLKLTDSLCAFIEGRSRFARSGLFVHVSSGLVQPGSNNHQVLEIFNASPNELELVPGTRICQLVFMRATGGAAYSGSFQNQTRP